MQAIPLRDQPPIVPSMASAMEKSLRIPLAAVGASSGIGPDAILHGNGDSSVGASGSTEEILLYCV